MWVTVIITLLNRIKDAVQLKKTPDRVPIIPLTTFAPTSLAGISGKEAMGDAKALGKAAVDHMAEFDPDAAGATPMVMYSPGLEVLDYKLYKWPGNGLATDVESYQFVDGEYMMADEYDSLIKDPSGFALRVLVPRVIGALEPLQKLVPGVSMLQMPLSFLAPAAMPDVQAAFQTIINAGKEMAKWQEAVGHFSREALAMGFRSIMGAGAIAPFDTIGNMLRGTRGIMIDMHRQPEKLLELCNYVLEQTLARPLAPPNEMGYIRLFMTITRGSDNFLSVKQWDRFYWPTFKKLITELVKRGGTPCIFFEGNCDTRMEYLLDLPKGKFLARLDQTDIFRAKEILKDHVCIEGNVPSSLLQTGTVDDVKACVKRLIDVVGKDGGYIVSTNSSTDHVKPENLKAMIDFTKEYGVYR